ncbi:Cation/H+ exchanger, CPA1 family like protein [Aduncisulcus paluster]|uniref:Cation/H+ exchanger, CPA1 family like protein n=1 Tax=Aduncisulcus paluster TaxID=2918883 RepID=A0ABQ5K1Z4_9EUKA|nr:Cation/H+ exchanger, CPA1 family like protein [Aduncisulcus paluster]
MNKSMFFRNIGSIFLFAFVGTIISTIFIGLFLWALSSSGIFANGYSFLDCFAYGSIISAVDPVATLAIFSVMDANPILHMLVFGESVINDAVSMVLFNTFMKFYEHPNVDFVTILSIIGSFLLASIGSIFIGISMAVICALFFKYINLRQFPHFEFVLMFCFSYLSYMLAEAAELSGIMAILFCDPILHMLVFGESVINDAVSMVLFNTFMKFYEHPNVDFVTILSIIGSFLLASIGSIFIGISMAVICALFFKYINLRQFPHFEFVLMFCFSYLSYMLAEAAELSGIMAILFCAIVISQYAQYNISDRCRRAYAEVVKSLSFATENIVFIFLGSSLFCQTLSWDFALIVFTFIGIVIGRALNIFPLSALLNTKRKPKINGKFQFVMFWSGLRGAIAFALTLSMPYYAETFTSTTLIIVMITIVLFGGTTAPILQKLHLTRKDGVDVTESGSTDARSGGKAVVDGLSMLPGKKMSRMEQWEREKIRPLLLKPGIIVEDNEEDVVYMAKIGDSEEDTHEEHKVIRAGDFRTPFAGRKRVFSTEEGDLGAGARFDLTTSLLTQGQRELVDGYDNSYGSGRSKKNKKRAQDDVLLDIPGGSEDFGTGRRWDVHETGDLGSI